jgi:hypothetical protein
MSPEITRYLISAAFLLNGVLMLGAALTLPVALQKEGGAYGHSWLLSRFGNQVEAVVGTILWGLAGIGFIGAAVGFFIGADWWQLFAWVGAPATVAAIALWFAAVPPGTYVGGMMAALTIGWIAFLRG